MSEVTAGIIVESDMLMVRTKKKKVKTKRPKSQPVYCDPAPGSLRSHQNEFDCDNVDTMVRSNPFPRFEHRVNDN